jgi:small-conductance mechanosensitive channel
MTFGINEAFNIVQSKLEGWMEYLTSLLPNIVVSIIVLVTFYLLSRGVRVASRKVLRRLVDQEAIVSLFSNILALLTISVGLIIALNLLHLSKAVTSLLAGAGIIGLAIGFAFQDISANFISGIAMAVKQPIKVGDIIETNSYVGFVKEIQMRATVIETFQGLHVIIPNRMIFQNPLTNYTKTYKRRVDLAVGVSYGEDLEKVRDVTLNAVKSNQYLTAEDEIKLVYDEFGDSSINFKIMFWVQYAPDNPMYLEARSEAIMAIKKAYNEHDIVIPFPIRTLDFGIKGGEKLNEHISTKDMKLLSTAS